MPETKKISKEVFARFQERLNNLSPEEHSRVINDLIEQLYQYIHDYAKRIDKPNPLKTTALANSYIRNLMEDDKERLIEPFLKASAFPQYLKYLQRGIAWFVSNKIAKENKEFPFVQPPIDANTDQEMEFSEDYQPERAAQELFESLIDILSCSLTDDQKQLLEMRLGVKFVNEEVSTQLINYQKPMTFPEIAAELGQSVDTVQKRYNRLIDKIKESPAITLFYRDF